MTDDFITALQSDWRGQPATPTELGRRLRRQRFAAIAVVALELAGAAAAFAIGAWFGAIALATGRLIFTVSSIVLMTATPALAIASVRARRDTLRWEEETPAGVMRFRRRQVEATLRALRLGWWAIGLMAAFLGVLWTLELSSLLREREFLTLYTTITLAYLAAACVWILMRRPRLRAERDACDRLLAELGEA